MICRDDLPETPEWSLPVGRLWMTPECPTATIATAELDALGTE